MEYTIRKLADLAGVTTRTLRWYDKLGLLRPGRGPENGYRLYGPAEVDRLQQILFYRALGVELARIKEILDDPSFDRVQALRGHLRALQGEQDRIRTLIDAVRETIRAEERKENMTDEKKFAAFKAEQVQRNEARYGREARERYGDLPVDQAAAHFQNLTREEYDRYAALEEEIKTGLEQAVRRGDPPKGEAGRELARLHRQWLEVSLGGGYTPEKHRGIVRLYPADERFRQYYDRNTPGCAQFLQDAVLRWIE